MSHLAHPSGRSGKWSAPTDEIIDHIRSDARCLGLLLFGSQARATAGCDSDLDLLIVHRDPVPEDLLDDLPPHVAISFYTPQRLQALPLRSPLFAIHLAREGIVLRDDTHSLQRTLARVMPLSTETSGKIGKLTLRRFRDLRRDVNASRVDAAYAATETYALGKQIAMLWLAERKQYEFDRNKALERFSTNLLTLRCEVEAIEELEPLWLQARRSEAPSVPMTDKSIRDASSLEKILSMIVIDEHSGSSSR